MATKITVALEDDLDGGPADETRRFAIRGTAYEIDLNKKNARALASNWRPSSSAPQGRPAADERDHAQPGCVAIQVVCQVCQLRQGDSRWQWAHFGDPLWKRARKLATERMRHWQARRPPSGAASGILGARPHKPHG